MKLNVLFTDGAVFRRHALITEYGPLNSSAAPFEYGETIS